MDVSGEALGKLGDAHREGRAIRGRDFFSTWLESDERQLKTGGGAG